MLIINTIILSNIEKTACIIEFYLQVLCNRASVCSQLSISQCVNWGCSKGQTRANGQIQRDIGGGGGGVYEAMSEITLCSSLSSL